MARLAVMVVLMMITGMDAIQRRGDGALEPASVSSESSESMSTSSSSLAADVGRSIPKYNAFLQRNARYAKGLSTLFASLDANHDQQLDHDELEQLHHQGQLSSPEFHLVHSFDVDASGTVSAEEFRMGPLFLSILERDETHQPTLRHDFLDGVDDKDSTVDVRPLYRDALHLPPAHVKTAVAKPTIFLETFRAPASPPRKQSPRIQDGDTVTDDLGIQVPRQEEEERLKKQATLATTKERALVQQTQTFGPAVAALGGALAAGAGAAALGAAAGGIGALAVGAAQGGGGSSSSSTGMPMSQFGVPSFADEKCVVCQYVAQRMQIALYEKLLKGTPDGFSDANGPPLAAAMDAAHPPPDPIEMKRLISQLSKRPGGQAVVRIVCEDVMSDFCSGATLPELFHPVCDDLWPKLSYVIRAIYYQFPSDSVCEEAKLCGMWTYFNKNSAVHLPINSKKYNSGRGLCGMLGGVHERKREGTSSIMCWGAKMLLK